MPHVTTVRGGYKAVYEHLKSRGSVAQHIGGWCIERSKSRDSVSVCVCECVCVCVCEWEREGEGLLRDECSLTSAHVHTRR